LGASQRRLIVHRHVIDGAAGRSVTDDNLFDEENSPRRRDKIARALGRSIVGWTAALRDRKIDQLASVITKMNAGASPPQVIRIAE
jgi:hypothetical protein